MIAAIVLLHAASCSGNDTAVEPTSGSGGATSTEDSGARAADGPAITVTAPDESAVLESSAAWLEVEVRDFVVAPTTEAASADGYWTISVNGEIIDFSTDTTGGWATRLAEGSNDVVVELVDSSGEPLDPPARDELALEVAPGSPFVKTELVSQRPSGYDVSVEVAGFELDPNWVTAREPIAGVGHYHIYTDRRPDVATTGVHHEYSEDHLVGFETTWLQASSEPGDEVLIIALATNDHLEMDAFDFVRVTLE